MKKRVEEVLQVDHDWKMPKKWMGFYVRTRRSLLESLGYEVKDIIWRESSSRKGYHIWIHIVGPPLTDEEKNMFQWLIGCDDPVRVRINQTRIKRRISKWWSKLFHEVRAFKGFKGHPPRSCRNCKIVGYLRELEAEVEAAEEEESGGSENG
jgi:hypothetical protein